MEGQYIIYQGIQYVTVFLDTLDVSLAFVNRSSCLYWNNPIEKKYDAAIDP